jgi:hypothetical protein
MTKTHTQSTYNTPTLPGKCTQSAQLDVNNAKKVNLDENVLK